MNKTIKRILSLALVALSFSFFNGSSSFGSKAVYASGSSLDSLSLDGVRLYENSNYTKEMKDGNDLKKTYYAKLSSNESKVSVDADGFDGVVKITKSKSKKVYDLNEDITILTGKTTLYVNLYDEYNEDGNNTVKKQYKIEIRRYSKEEEKSSENDDEGNVYLQSLQLDYGDIPLGFKRDKTEYNVDVDKDTKSLAIYAQPEDGADEVRINNILVNENDEYKKNIKLSQGTTKVEIELSYNDEKRVYTINITRKENTNIENNANADNIDDSKNKTENTESKTENTEIKNETINQNINSEVSNKPGWVKINNNWQYNDDYGNSLKGTWFYDKNYNKKYYFNNEGIMQTGWLNNQGSWYYLNESGAMETGWKLINSKWYYMDYDGKMKSGWFKDINGSYYYLDSSGAMLTNTTVEGYKLGSNGAWIK